MKRISKIKKGLLQRNSSLLKYAVKTGINVIKHRDDPAKVIESIIGVNPKKFIDDLSHYKGSITKAGQLISQYGEYYLSDEINEKLRLLQSSTHYLDYEVIEKQIAPHIIDELSISKDPIAAASIGQVHKATHRKNSNNYVLKIQYQGIEKAIGGDLVFLKLFLNGVKIVPKGVDTSHIFNEVERVLKAEMDYEREAKVLTSYAEKLNDNYYRVPKVYPEFSTKKVLCMDYMEGIHLSDIYKGKSKSDYDLEKINHLGAKIFELFLREIFEIFMVQTDAHGGNFFITEDLDHLTLLDFGACLEYPKEQLEFYQNFLIHGHNEDRESFMKEFYRLIEYTKNPLEFSEDKLWEYMLVASSPLRSENYNWETTDLPDRLMELGKELQKTMKFKSIPSDFIFIDRKVMGVFTLLRSLKCQFNVKKVFQGVAL
jgi:predicted unusual protein kinase regulating ubiquinone biosynthesis (AarF/ABC1/UbiB family)